MPYENISLEDCPTLQSNRCRDDFKLIKILGEGGCGAVYKVFHRTDQHEYALKKIKLRVNESFRVNHTLNTGDSIIKIDLGGNMELKKLLREVRVLAKLDHKNIVGYNSSWLEDSSDSNGAEFSDSDGSQSSGRDNTNNSNLDVKNEASEANSPLRHNLILYIQMEVCITNLQEWLEDVNNVFKEKYNEKIRIFIQILEGVDYVHKKGLMHRDLKPVNIFLSGPNLLVKIGDFGLAKYLKNGFVEETVASSAVSSDPEHTIGIGTELYASPEILTRSEYDCKTDMYSLGVILFVMYNNFKTEMERIIEIGQLRDKSICSLGFKQQFKPVATVVEKLINYDPKKRPTADEILNDELFSSKNEVAPVIAASGDEPGIGCEEADATFGFNARSSELQQKVASVITASGDERGIGCQETDATLGFNARSSELQQKVASVIAASGDEPGIGFQEADATLGFNARSSELQQKVASVIAASGDEPGIGFQEADATLGFNARSSELQQKVASVIAASGDEPGIGCEEADATLGVNARSNELQLKELKITSIGTGGGDITSVRAGAGGITSVGAGAGGITQGNIEGETFGTKPKLNTQKLTDLHVKVKDQN